VSEETLRGLWKMEKKLLTLLHVDSTGSRMWFLDDSGLHAHGLVVLRRFGWRRGISGVRDILCF
jgi:hypothetical protein